MKFSTIPHGSLELWHTRVHACGESNPRVVKLPSVEMFVGVTRCENGKILSGFFLGCFHCFLRCFCISPLQKRENRCSFFGGRLALFFLLFSPLISKLCFWKCFGLSPLTKTKNEGHHNIRGWPSGAYPTSIPRNKDRMVDPN